MLDRDRSTAYEQQLVAVSSSSSNNFGESVTDEDYNLSDRMVKPLTIRTGDNHFQSSNFNMITVEELLNKVKSPVDLSHIPLDDHGSTSNVKSSAPWFLCSDSDSKRRSDLELHNNYTCAWVDIDDGNNDINHLSIMLKALDIEQFAIYSTVSSTVKSKRWRVIVPVNRAMTLAEYKGVQSTIASFFGADDCAEKTTQIAYLPTLSCLNKDHYQYEIVNGAPLDIDSANFKPAIDLAKASLEAKRLVRAEDEKRAVESRSGDTLINLFVIQYSIAEILIDNGYAVSRCGTKFRHPDSHSGQFSAVIGDKGRVFTHSTEDPLYVDESQPGRAHDAFGAFVVLNHGGDKNKAWQDAATNWVNVGNISWSEHTKNLKASNVFGQSHAVPVSKLPNVDCEFTQRATASILGYLKSFLCVPYDVEAFDESIIDRNAIAHFLNTSYWMDGKTRCAMFNDKEQLITFPPQKALEFLNRTYGSFIKLNVDKMSDDQRTYIVTKAEELKKNVIYVLAKIRNEVIKIVFNECQYSNQSGSIHNKMDMFSNHSYMNFIRDQSNTVEVVHHWKPFNVGHIDMSIVNDYKNHYPQFDDLIDLVGKSLFSTNRKKAYLWLKCESDWGKGFLQSAFDELKLLCTMSVKEVEKAFEGSPLGKNVYDFLGRPIIWVDEFKNVKSELKQLESKLTISPKHMLQQSLDIYVKIFTSADSVDSLVSQYGVETQFANRFSLHECGGASIDERLKMLEVGNVAYLASVSNYIADRLNTIVKEYRSQGPTTAKQDANNAIVKFWDKYKICNTKESLAENLSSIVEEFKIWCIAERKQKAPFWHQDIVTKNIMVHEGNIVIKKCSSLVDIFIDQECPFSEKPMMRKAKSRIVDLIGSEISTRVNGVKMRVRILCEYSHQF